MIIKFFHEGQTMLIDGVEFCKYRTLEMGEQVIVRNDVRDYTNFSIPAGVPCSPVGRNVTDGAQAEYNPRLEFLYERSGNPGQLLCYRPVFLMSDEGKTIERI